MSDLDKSPHIPSSSPASTKNEQTPNALGGSLDKFGSTINSIASVETVQNKPVQKKTHSGQSGNKKKSDSTIQIVPTITYIPETPKEIIEAIRPKLLEKIQSLQKEADVLAKQKPQGFAFKLQVYLRDIRILSSQLSGLVHLTMEKLVTIYKGFFPKAIEREKKQDIA